MSYVFDGDRTTAIGTLIASGYLALLDPLLVKEASVPGPRGPYLRTVRQLPFDPSKKTVDIDPFWKLLGALPGGYVVVGDATHQGSQTYEIEWLFDVRIYVASDWAGQFVEGRLHARNIGDETTDPGIFVMIQHATELLQAQELPAPGLCSGTVTVRGWRQHIVTEAWTMWVIDTTLAVIQTIDEDRDTEHIDAIKINQAVQPRGAISSQRKVFP